ncbi:MAG: hypothetical protein ACRD27_06295 [Terracidiphilus sp.]
MHKPTPESPSHSSMILLSRLLLPAAEDRKAPSATRAKLGWELSNLGRNEFEDLCMLAQMNHVIVRGLHAFADVLREERDGLRLQWAHSAIEAEQARIARAVHFLHEICVAFAEWGLDAMAIKTLDHWPDLGSDLDLYTDAGPEDVAVLMKSRFHAQIAPRSWGDRLAGKWNFLVPGLPEAVEIHVGRLGQTGEHVAMAASLVEGSRTTTLGGYSFQVPSASDRLMISTLQRMYRHFYFRLCDVIDTVALADAGGIDYEKLRTLAETAGIWQGVATYLRIVSDYARGYRGAGLEMPPFVAAAARFGGGEVYFGRGYLRVPILPQSAWLYGSQLTGLLARGELQSGARLSLLPWLATAAVVGQKLTGSDKGIW